MRIGIMGTPIDSCNLGCMALTYSLLLTLKQIEKEEKLDFEYLIFDGTDNPANIEILADVLEIDRKKIISGHMTLLCNPLRILKHFKNTIRMVNEIKNCDCIIDVTGGDSFSDIYGKVTFRGRTNVKLLVEKLKKPLLLAPQTYGPFKVPSNERMAIKAVKRASCVMTRDVISLQWLNEVAHTKAVYTTDMAFLLPYNNDKQSSGKVCIGINASQLLFSSGTEVQEKNFILTVDYEKYLQKILAVLSDNSDIEVYLIPHVDLDFHIHKRLAESFKSLHVVQPFSSPIEAKSFISKMDIFIGARMHGTIAAFTSGVACIPTAYSIKFNGLFKSLGYDYLIDLQRMTTEEAIETTLRYIDHQDELKEQAKKCYSQCESYKILTVETIKNWIKEVHKQIEGA